MKLPQVNVPKYEVQLHSIAKPVKFRPFLVKEQKILLTASESKDKQEISSVLLECLSNCVEEGLNIHTLPIFDLIYLFMKVRSKSVGEIVELAYSCDHKNDSGETCGTEVHFGVNLEELNITVPEGHSQIVPLTSDIGVKMRYPTISDSFTNTGLTNPIEQIMFLADCIESVYTAEDVIEVNDLDAGELISFLDSLTIDQLSKMMDFFKSMPTVVYTQEVHCPKCGTPRTINIDELDGFF